MKVYDWNGKAILIVDDNELNCHLLHRMIEPTGAKVIIANDGKPAIEECFNNLNISLVLMDIQMPEMDGYEATRTIKSIRPEVPVIAQTAYFVKEEREKMKQAGCDEYISKPIRPKELLELLNKYFRK